MESDWRYLNPYMSKIAMGVSWKVSNSMQFILKLFFLKTVLRTLLIKQS